MTDGAAGTALERVLEEALLGGALSYNRREVTELAGMPLEYGMRLWQALGFPTPPDDAIAFTDADVAALREVQELLTNPFVDEDMVLHMARAVGQTMGRLANWLGDVWIQRLTDHPELRGDGAEFSERAVAAALLATQELRPIFERLLLHGWRRQLAADGIRALTNTAAAIADPVGGTAQLAVGFADVVSFTRLSRQMDGDALATFVNRFETGTMEIIADLGGRVVKTLGDEVLFVADDATAGAEIGLRIAERVDIDPEFPRVRVGLAHGEIIQRLGDVFGTPVNLAARLTSAAHPATVLADGALVHLLGETGAYDAVPLRPRPLQGLGRVRPWVLRRRGRSD
ncbi:MAG: adenylate/guanylate cyclase domain-containing protein [Actinomadura sp.]